MKFEPPHTCWLLGTNCWMLLFILLKLGKFWDSVQVRFVTLCEKWYNLFYLSEALLINISLWGKYYIEGSPVTMACEASGKPLPDVAWIRNGVLESSGKKAAFLKFNNINRTDAGQYTCRANNSVEVTSIDTSIVVQCKYILTLIYYFWQICSKVKGNRIPHQILFGFVCIGPNYWLGQLNLRRIIAHVILHRRMWHFLISHCFSWTVFNSENGLKPFPNHCDISKFTPFD